MRELRLTPDMNAAQLNANADRAQAIYDRDLKAQLEASRPNEFVAIDPDTGDHFVGKTMSEASRAARNARPDAIPLLIRIGHETAVQIGGLSTWTDL
jgi:hypothetical protein